LLAQELRSQTARIPDRARADNRADASGARRREQRAVCGAAQFAARHARRRRQ